MRRNCRYISIVLQLTRSSRRLIVCLFSAWDRHHYVKVITLPISWLGFCMWNYCILFPSVMFSKKIQNVEILRYTFFKAFWASAGGKLLCRILLLYFRRAFDRRAPSQGCHDEWCNGCGTNTGNWVSAVPWSMSTWVGPEQRTFSQIVANQLPNQI